MVKTVALVHNVLKMANKVNVKHAKIMVKIVALVIHALKTVNKVTVRNVLANSVMAKVHNAIMTVHNVIHVLIIATKNKWN